MSGISATVIPTLKLIDAQTAQNFYAPFPAQFNGKYTECTVQVVFSTGSAAGAVVVEASPVANFTGTWANVATITWAAENSVKYAAVTGVFSYIRVRISTAVTTGTCDVYVVAAN